MHILNHHFLHSFEWKKEQLLAFRTVHPFYAVRLDSRGRVIILPAQVGFLELNSSLLYLKVWDWYFQEGDAGVILDNQTPIPLGEGKTCQPAVSWFAEPPTLEATPDFVVLMRKSTDSLARLHRQIITLMENGCELAWLIDPYNQTACIYRSDGTGEIIEDFRLSALSGESVLPGLEVPLSLLIEHQPGMLIPFLEAQSN